MANTFDWKEFATGTLGGIIAGLGGDDATVTPEAAPTPAALDKKTSGSTLLIVALVIGIIILRKA